jgi:hypothetical protein
MAVHPARVPRRRIETDGGRAGEGRRAAARPAGRHARIVTVLMWADARQARDEGSAAAPSAPPAAHDHATDHNTALPISSFAGVVPSNAQALAKAHKAYDATMPPVPSTEVVKVHMTRPSR